MDATTQARHDANRADLVQARADLEASFEAEDLEIANARKEALASIDRGLAHHDAMVANGGVMPSADELNKTDAPATEAPKEAFEPPEPINTAPPAPVDP